MGFTILVVDDDASHRLMLEAVLKAEGFEVCLAEDGAGAVAAVEERFFDLILMDIRMGQMNGIDAMKSIKQISPGIPVIIMTAYASVDTAVDALKMGATDYLTKPLDVEELKKQIRKHLARSAHGQKEETIVSHGDLDPSALDIIGQGAAMRVVFETISMVAPTEATVLITGESGTGKELVAGAVHGNSRRKDNPLVTVNCAALPETLLESELFGHEKGAFTGATNRKQGRFRTAHKGTIFLDEVAEMPVVMQPKLLRVLQEREVDPIGGSRTVAVDTRVIAATNRDLPKEIEAGTFREDLFYRLNVVNIHVPALRERREDIPLLTQYFLDKFNRKNQKLVKGLSPKAMDCFMRYDWPGNVRELENMIERAVILSRGDMIEEGVLPATIQSISTTNAVPEYHPPVGKSLKEVEKEMIIRTLANTDGNRTRTAEILGISRRTLQLKLKSYNASG